jgi:transposase
MGEVTTIGLDFAKHVQVHGVDAEGATVLRKQLRRAHLQSHSTYIAGERWRVR